MLFRSPQAPAVVRRAGPPVHAPRPVAVVPTARRPVAPITVRQVEAKSRTPLYAGITVVMLGVIVAIGIALQKQKPKYVEERTVPNEEVPKEEPLAKLPETTPTPAPIAETPGEQPPATSPEMKPTPAPAAQTPAATPQSTTEKWLVEQEPQWQAAFVLEVSAPFEKAAADLQKQYLSALDTQLATATRTGHLYDSVAFRDEIQRMNGGGVRFEDDSSTPAALKAVRSGYRKNFAILETDRAAKARVVHARYDAILAQNQALLTQRQRFDEALLLKAKREELTASWIKPLTVLEAPGPQPVPANPGVTATPLPSPSAPKTKGILGSFYVSVDDSVTIYLNGQVVHNARIGETRSPEVELHTSDRILVELINTGGPRRFMLAFGSSDRQLVVSFRHRDFKVVPDLNITDFKSDEFIRWQNYAKPAKLPPKLPVKSYSEWVWGDLDRCILAAIIRPEMIRLAPQ